MTRRTLTTLFLVCLAMILHAETTVVSDSMRIDTRNDAILLTSANSKLVSDLIPNQVYTVTVNGTSTAPMQGVFFMLQTPTEHEFRFVPFGRSFTFVPVNGSHQLAAFYVDWSLLDDNAGAITVSIAGPTSKTLAIDPRNDAILLDPVAKMVNSLTPGIPFVVSVAESAISGTPLRGALFMYQEAGGEVGFKFVPAGEGFVFTPIDGSYQIAGFYVDWSTTADNQGTVYVNLERREPIARTLTINTRNDALLLTPDNAKIVGDLPPNQVYTVSVTSTVSDAPMKGAFFMLQTPTEHRFRYVAPGESFTFVPVNASYQLAAFYVDWSNLADNSGIVTITIRDASNVTKKTLTLDAKTNAILLDTTAFIQTGLVPIPPKNAWVASVRESGVTGTPVTGAYFMYLDSGLKFHFRYIAPGSAVVFNPAYPAIYQIAPLNVDWSTVLDNTGNVIVELSGPTYTDVQRGEQPVEFYLRQNFPNPFNPSTSIRFSISERSEVLLSVFNILGQRVATLVNEEKPAGEYDVTFGGQQLSSGVYYYQLRAGQYVETRSMLLLR